MPGPRRLGGAGAPAYRRSSLIDVPPLTSAPHLLSLLAGKPFRVTIFPAQAGLGAPDQLDHLPWVLLDWTGAKSELWLFVLLLWIAITNSCQFCFQNTPESLCLSPSQASTRVPATCMLPGATTVASRWVFPHGLSPLQYVLQQQPVPAQVACGISSVPPHKHSMIPGPFAPSSAHRSQPLRCGWQPPVSPACAHTQPALTTLGPPRSLHLYGCPCSSLPGVTLPLLLTRGPQHLAGPKCLSFLRA